MFLTSLKIYWIIHYHFFIILSFVWVILVRKKSCQKFITLFSNRSDCIPFDYNSALFDRGLLMILASVCSRHCPDCRQLRGLRTDKGLFFEEGRQNNIFVGRHHSNMPIWAAYLPKLLLQLGLLLIFLSLRGNFCCRWVDPRECASPKTSQAAEVAGWLEKAAL